MRIDEIAKELGLELAGDSNREITGPATLSDAGPENISFFHNRRYMKQLEETSAGAVILSKKFLDDNARFTSIISTNPLDDYRKVVEIFYPRTEIEPEISDLAYIHPEAKLSENIRIEPFAVIGKCTIGKGSMIGAGSVIGDSVSIGENVIIYPRVVIYHNCSIGNNVILHSGSVIGSDGFGYSRTDDGAFHKIQQVGRVIIEDFAEIGANTTIDRGSLEDTIIGHGTKIDNLVQIAHNVKIGSNCAIAGQVGIAGSCKLGNGVQLAGQVGLAGHLELGDGVIVLAQSGVDKSFESGKIILGSPARPSRETLKQWAAMAKLPEIIKMLKK